jgi:hypothetical protein
MFYCHLVIIYKNEQTNLVIFKYNQNSKILQKNQKNLLLKNIFQNNIIKYEFFNVFILSSLSTGSYTLKKKTFLNVLHEVTYKLNLEKNKEKYYIGKFYLKTACLALINIELFLKENFYDYKNIKNNDITNFVNSNLHKKISIIHFFSESKKNFHYNFNSSKSKLSTSFLDEIFMINLNLKTKNLYYLDILNPNKILEISFFFKLFSLKSINLYIFFIRNSKARSKMKIFSNLSFNSIINKVIKLFTFFLGFFSQKKFFLSTEIIFCNKIYGLNPIKYIIDRYFQIIKENNKSYFYKFHNFSKIRFDKFFSNQIKKHFFDIKNLKYTRKNLIFQRNKVSFQKKFIERIAEKIWNLKLRFSEFNLDLYFKQFKKIKENYQRKNLHFYKWVWMLIIYSQINNIFYKIRLVVYKTASIYKLLNSLNNVNSYLTLKNWNNIEIDSIVYFLSNLKNVNVNYKFFLKNFQNLIFKKSNKYYHNLYK